MEHKVAGMRMLTREVDKLPWHEDVDDGMEHQVAGMRMLTREVDKLPWQCNSFASITAALALRFV